MNTQWQLFLCGYVQNSLLILSAGRGMIFVGRGSAGRSARPDSRPVPTREELDAQLDDYMSMTKSQLDAQLDAYMAEVSKDLLYWSPHPYRLIFYLKAIS